MGLPGFLVLLLRNMVPPSLKVSLKGVLFWMAVYSSPRPVLQPREQLRERLWVPFLLPLFLAELGAPTPKVEAEGPLMQEWESPFPRGCMSVHITSIPEWAYLPLVEGRTAPLPPGNEVVGSGPRLPSLPHPPPLHTR